MGFSLGCFKHLTAICTRWVWSSTATTPSLTGTLTAGQECTGWLPPGQAWLPGTPYELLSSWVPGDCMVALGFNMHELSLLRLQKHVQQQPGVAPHLVKELFLGECPHRLGREAALPSHWLPVPPAKCSGEYGALWVPAQQVLQSGPAKGLPYSSLCPQLRSANPRSFAHSVTSAWAFWCHLQG